MLFSFWLCGTRCRQCLLISGIRDTRCRQCSSHFGFVVLAAGNALLLSAVCGIRYRRGHPMVRNMRAVLKTGSWGTRRIFRGIRCKKQAFPVRKGYSVPETPFYGTNQDSSNRKRVSLALYATETTWQSSFSAWLSQIPHNSHPRIRRQCDNT